MNRTNFLEFPYMDDCACIKIFTCAFSPTSFFVFVLWLLLSFWGLVFLLYFVRSSVCVQSPTIYINGSWVECNVHLGHSIHDGRATWWLPQSGALYIFNGLTGRLWEHMNLFDDAIACEWHESYLWVQNSFVCYINSKKKPKKPFVLKMIQNYKNSPDLLLLGCFSSVFISTGSDIGQQGQSRK